MANWVRQRRQNHQTGHGQTADLFAKIRPNALLLQVWLCAVFALVISLVADSYQHDTVNRIDMFL